METLIYVMIYSGSALMVYNIARCYGFVKRMWKAEVLSKIRWVLPIPLALLIFFLVGYLFVGVFGQPDLMIGGILFGGSVFVAIVFGIMYLIIDRLSEGNARASARYDEIRNELLDLAKGYVAVFRANLTQDVIEDKGGPGFFDTDNEARTYTEFLAMRRKYRITAVDADPEGGRFTRENLLKSYNEGVREVEEILFAGREEGQSVFVKMHATLTTKPDSNDIIAFISESICNDEMVNDVLLNKALSGQYDMITSLVGGRYSVVIGEGGNKPGSIFPAEPIGDYNAYLARQVEPVICGAPEERSELLEALSIESVERELAVSEPYEVNIAIELDGETFYKRFVYYVVDPVAKFYLLLKSDTTETRREEVERNKMLSEALEVAQRASKSKTTFLSNMSHDIRTPMNAIVGYTDFARRSDTIEEAHEYLEKIDASNKYMLALIDDVLEMSRIESGKMEIVTEPVNLLAIMDEASDLFENQMAQKGITFSMDVSKVRDACVHCDKTRFNRVLLNLLSNAYKFTPEGGSVSMSLAQLDDEREGFGAYELRVKDSGIGMSEEFAARVFDAFERERNTTASGIQGTGLGMAISKRIVDMMGGTIDLVTAPGEGTEFIIRLQFEYQQGEDAQACALSYGSASADEEIDFEGRRVLLVEDNEINREIASMVLEELGFSVDEAVDGQQAVDTLVAHGPGCYDVVVTDIQMPVMDGYAEARAIRALDDPELAGVPIIAMSANAFQEDKQASREAGMNAHIAKPIDVAALTKTLGEVLRA